MSIFNIFKKKDLPFQSVVLLYLHPPHLVYFQWHPVLVEPLPAHVRRVDEFSPPFELRLLLHHELRGKEVNEY